MKNLSKNQLIISIVFQVVAAIILALAAFAKFNREPMAVYIFDTLGIPGSMLIIAIIEGLTALMLLTRWAHFGALLGFGTMIGAFIAHFTVLGANVEGDGGAMVARLIVVILATLIIMYIRRHRLPLVGRTFS